MTKSPLEATRRIVHPDTPTPRRSRAMLAGLVVSLAAILALGCSTETVVEVEAEAAAEAVEAEPVEPTEPAEPAEPAEPVETEPAPATAEPLEDGAAGPLPDPDASSSMSFGGATIPETDFVGYVGDPLPPLENPADDPAIGLAAPLVTATSLSTGEEVYLDPGAPRIVGFFAHWCPHCQRELPELTAWLEANPLPNNGEFVAVSTVVSSERDNYPPSDWFNAEGWNHPVIVDDASATLLSTYGFSGFPAFIAIDADGVVVDRLSGNVGEAGFERLAAAIAN